MKSPEERQAKLDELTARVEAGEAKSTRGIHRSTKDKATILKHGVDGTARILALRDGGRANEFRALVGLELEVKLPARSLYVVETGEYVTAAAAGSIAPGRELVVKVDREDPTRVAVDWDQSLRVR